MLTTARFNFTDLFGHGPPRSVFKNTDYSESEELTSFTTTTTNEDETTMSKKQIKKQKIKRKKEEIEFYKKNIEPYIPKPKKK